MIALPESSKGWGRLKASLDAEKIFRPGERLGERREGEMATSGSIWETFTPSALGLVVAAEDEKVGSVSSVEDAPGAEEPRESDVDEDEAAQGFEEPGPTWGKADLKAR